MKPKTVKNCRDCGNEFSPYKTTDTRCVGCLVKFVVKDNQRKRDKVINDVLKPIRKKNKKLEEDMMTLSDWLKRCQKYFNKFIRLRDKSRLCISCSNPLITNPGAWKAQFDAGHFYSVGAYPNLRFNEDNCHGQCVRCNRDLHSNNTEYQIRLPERIGVDALIELKSIRHKPLNISIPEVKELIEHYKQLIKSMS